MASNTESGSASERSVGNRAPFPLDPNEFADDDRISFSRAENQYLLEDENGAEWTFDASLTRWIPTLDEALIQQQSSAYVTPGQVPADAPDSVFNKRKRRDNLQKEAKKQKPAYKNSAVYVTQLPLDTDKPELEQLFKKYGLLAKTPATEETRIKLYEDENGRFKGEALVVYHRPESVKLAIDMLDGTPMRFDSAHPAQNIVVKEADLSFKKNLDDKPQDSEAHAPGSRKPKLSEEKKQVLRHKEKMNRRLADWDDDDPQSSAPAPTIHDREVVLKHMFTLQELKDDADAAKDIQDDIMSEGEKKCGKIEKIILYDLESDGIVLVRFKDVLGANKAVDLFHNRHFGGQRIIATIADGSENYAKAKPRRATNEWDIPEEERLQRFGAMLDGE